MIPLKDTSPHKGFPGINAAIIAVNVWVYLETSHFSRVKLALFHFRFGLVPTWAIKTAEQQYFSGTPSFFFPLFSYMFVHAGIIHLLSNMWFLWVFGKNIEYRIGHFRYFIFYILCGIASGYFHIIFNPSSTVPCVGASGAVSGVIGAYMILYPRAKILTLVPIYFFIKAIEIPAFIFIIIWLLIQVTGAISSLSHEGGSVAWWAHFGGFLWGFLTVLLFKQDKLKLRIE